MWWYELSIVIISGMVYMQNPRQEVCIWVFWRFCPKPKLQNVVIPSLLILSLTILACWLYLIHAHYHSQSPFLWNLDFGKECLDFLDWFWLLNIVGEDYRFVTKNSPARGRNKWQPRNQRFSAGLLLVWWSGRLTFDFDTIFPAPFFKSHLLPFVFKFIPIFKGTLTFQKFFVSWICTLVAKDWVHPIQLFR